MLLVPVVGGGFPVAFWLCDRFKPGADTFADLGSGCSTRCLTRPGATSTAPSGATSGSLTGTAGSTTTGAGEWQIRGRGHCTLRCKAEKQGGS